MVLTHQNFLQVRVLTGSHKSSGSGGSSLTGGHFTDVAGSAGYGGTGRLSCLTSFANWWTVFLMSLISVVLISGVEGFFG